MKISLTHIYRISIGFALLSCFAGPWSAYAVKIAEQKAAAAAKNQYSASLVKLSEVEPINLLPGKNKTVTITFKNTGLTTWEAKGKKFVSAYTSQPRGRTSVFADAHWINSKQTGKLTGDVAPGKTGTMVFSLTAPKQPGIYTEYFSLAAENTAWIKGGDFSLKITVPAVTTTVPVLPAAASSTGVYSSNRFILNPKAITARGGDVVTIIGGWQNNGQNPWPNYTLVPSITTAATTSFSNSFADASWKNRTVVRERAAPVAPDAIAREEFQIRMPRKPGTYTAQFSLQANGAVIPGSELTIPVTVTDSASSDYQEVSFPGETLYGDSVTASVATSTPEVPRLSEEPTIRVGVWKTEGSKVQVSPTTDDYVVFNGTQKVGILARGDSATLVYTGGVYGFRNANMTFDTNSFIRLVPANDPHAVFTLTNYTRRLSWKGNKNFNSYRGVLEYRVAGDSATVYVINEPLFEDYVAGIAENANTAPVEYLKAQATAQRTYAYYMKVYSSKHNSRNFDVVAHTGDQLYLGYASEQIMPRFVEAVAATRGQMIMYNNEVVITPYFGSTDGRTRSYKEVWGGKEKPWLVSVTATYDARDGLKKMSGHGVGMSQRDAAIRADEEGIDWVSLLQYYYTGIEVHRMYP